MHCVIFSYERVVKSSRKQYTCLACDSKYILVLLRLNLSAVQWKCVLELSQQTSFTTFCSRGARYDTYSTYLLKIQENNSISDSLTVNAYSSYLS